MSDVFHEVNSIGMDVFGHVLCASDRLFMAKQVALADMAGDLGVDIDVVHILNDDYGYEPFESPRLW